MFHSSFLSGAMKPIVETGGKFLSILAAPSVGYRLPLSRLGILRASSYLLSLLLRFCVRYIRVIRVQK